MRPAEPGRRKLGLALSGGAARGLAHIGVLNVLHNEGIPIDMIAGTSAGAVFGAIYAWNGDIDLVKKQVLAMNWKNLVMIDPSFFKNGIIKGKKIKDLLGSYIGSSTRFSELRIPFACTATDIDTGEAVVIDRGPVLEALRASISIPGIFTLTKNEGRRLVDGELTIPVPVSVVRRMGADFVIAVNLIPDVTGRIGKSKSQVRPQKEPNIFQVIMQALAITTYSLSRSSMADADIVIEPDLAHIGAGDFQKAREIIRRGEEAAQKAMPAIKKILKVL